MRETQKTLREQVKERLGTVSGVPRVARLVWAANPRYTAALMLLNVLQGLVPAANLWLTKLIVDVVAAAIARRLAGDTAAVLPAPALPFESLGLSQLFGIEHLPEAGLILSLIFVGAAIRLLEQTLEPASSFAQIQLGDYLTREMQSRILRKANSLADISYFENPTFYDSLQRAQQDAGYRPLNVLAGTVGMFRTSVQLLSMLGVLAAFQPALVVIALGLALPNLLLQFRQQVDNYALTRWTVPEVRKMRYFGEVVTWKDSAKELRIFGLGDYFLQRFLEEFHTFHHRFHRLRVTYFRWDMAMAVVTTLGNWTLYLYLVFLALGRRITLGDLTLYTQAVWQAHARVVDLVRQVSSLYGDILFVSQLFEFLDLPPAMAVRPPSEAVPPPRRLRHGIEFRNVSFAYPGTERPVLERFNLRIAPGECIALVGENGAGKTTIVKLLSRLYDPTEGQVLIDGIDLKAIDLAQWRAQMAAIFQDFSHYHLPAGTNIGLGNLSKLQDRVAIQTAAERGGATAVVEKLPEGYDTILGRWITPAGQEGAELSGGEWQKIALARAFMRSGEDGLSPSDGERSSITAPLTGAGSAGAQLLILDEPTAALDTQAEYDVYVRFHELTRGKATLLISHRFSTVRMADRIVVLENGHVIEQGTHAELLARGGTYADLYEKQASRYR